ncbi:ATP-binding protein [Acinetobacter baumannii]|uniref:ATP-binding protein n=1 Tax=Acinetobacter baumannii TaxID=470 RepID=UPI0008DDAB95|nr:ATP-binding protein [Acinetobacter baumannii]MDB0302214.1 ATP-binding protein [Acinetobacter baumannii]MDC5341805.1 ATP-binding protein [Acinetobacter baumannii]MDC5395523.1 ATP-binding protein [Acinetobacter baumannii]OIF73989.1 ATPase [Acinetobacter baumannii]
MPSQIKSRNAPPKASALIEALRGLGYNTATALADIIDNSISADANNIDLLFKWDEGKSYIIIYDDGNGMNSEEIDKAMRLGGKSPVEERDAKDLGRFGLGLKTASFSQCRKLTVISWGKDGTHSLRWDLDILANQEDGKWHLLEGPFLELEELEEVIKIRKDMSRGTMVIWEKLDRVISSKFTVDDWLNLMDQIEAHLSMVFHRYLEEENSKLTIRINGKAIKPWDPFLSDHPSKPWSSPVQPFKNTQIKIECHVLPHKDRLTARELKAVEGPNGWIAQQGFYIYRNKRLLVAGSWLGLKSSDTQRKAWVKDEVHKLARIKLDIPNSMDKEWEIDIRKAVARPPIYLRKWLSRHAEDTRNRARKVFIYRGHVIKKSLDRMAIQQVWKADHSPSGVRYKIDFEHEAISTVIAKAGDLLPELETMLKVIQETVPVQRIWLDAAENNEAPHTGFSNEPETEVLEVLTTLYKNMIQIKGMTPEQAKKRLMKNEPFNNYPDLIAGLLE